MVTGKMNIPDNSMALGSPARVVRKLTDAEIESNKKNAEEYVKLMKASKELNYAYKQGVKSMQMTTLCYIEKDNKYLMLHRTKKKNDINEGKWIGVGGHAEGSESPENV